MLTHLPLRAHYRHEGRVVGVIRVSTRKQEAGRGLDDQSELIRSFAREHDLTLLSVRGDSASGMGKLTHERNTELRAAIDLAAQEGADLLVSEISRLGRSSTLAQLLEARGVGVVSVVAGRALTSAEIRDGLQGAQIVGESITLRTRRALEQAREGGRRGGNPDLAAARKSSQRVRIFAKDELVERIARVLVKTDPCADLAAQQVAELLHAHGLHTSRGKSWSRSNIYRHLRLARKLVAAELSDDKLLFV